MLRMACPGLSRSKSFGVRPWGLKLTKGGAVRVTLRAAIKGSCEDN